jgi:DNA-binding XRE family transcriptional regulator
MSDDWRARREAMGLTRRDVALVAGVNLRTLALIETGRRRMTPGLGRWLTWVYARELRRRTTA